MSDVWWALVPLAIVASVTGTLALLDLIRFVRTAWRGHGQRPNQRTQAIYANPFTCRFDGLEHRVTDSAFREGQDVGRYTALCGHRVAPVLMEMPPGPRCAACLGILTGPRRQTPTGRHRYRCARRRTAAPSDNAR